MKNHIREFMHVLSRFGSESWMTDPFGLAPAANGRPIVDDVGNGEKSSYKEQTYTLPGAISYQE